ncbi:hypothetical protein ACIBUY_14640 [Streptomyces sp. NPDC050085]|uniref:hypothetical protein n=1 Tax=Streptomyces sp. NPDC050085 TaxID=3365600 RepID=UPI003794DA09
MGRQGQRVPALAGRSLTVPLPRLPLPRVLRLLVLLALVLLPLVLFAPASVSYAVEPSPSASLAGSRAGVGRTPPGRPLPTPSLSEQALPPVPPPVEPSATAAPRRSERPAAARQSVIARGTTGPGSVMNILPLGAGLLLTGVGIGFLALRLRR